MNNEQWRDIPGYEGFYQVSNIGRVRSVDRAIVRPTSRYVVRGRVIKPQRRDKYGHQTVSLWKNNKGKTAQVHALVMLAFVGERPDGMETRHLNGDPTDNRLENLAYGTKAENMEDAAKLGRYAAQKLNGELVKEIKARVAAGESQRSVGKVYGVDHAVIGRICRGTAYKWVI